MLHDFESLERFAGYEYFGMHVVMTVLKVNSLENGYKPFLKTILH